MPSDKISKAQEAARKATINLAKAVNEDEEQKRKRRNGRLMKLGILVEQMVQAGDLTLLSRLESAALECVNGNPGQFATRKVDRLDFGLDEDVNWFEQTREDAMLRKSQKAEKADSAKPVAESAKAAGANAPSAAPSKPAVGQAARAAAPSGNGANGPAGASASSSTAASA